MLVGTGAEVAIGFVGSSSGCAVGAEPDAIGAAESDGAADTGGAVGTSGADVTATSGVLVEMGWTVGGIRICWPGLMMPGYEILLKVIIAETETL